MSTFMRTVRPFVGLDALQRILDAETRLAVGPDKLAPDQTIQLSHEGFVVRDVELEIGSTDELFELACDALALKAEELDYDPGDVELVVVASSPYLKIADVVVRRRLTELAAGGRRISLCAPRPRALLSPRSGCSIDVYLVLSSSTAQKPLRPWRRGTWLAQVSFSISSELQPVGFTPRPLTPEIRDKYFLPDETVRFVVFDPDDSPLNEDSAETALLMYVDPETLAKIAVSSGKPASQLFQLELFLDAVRAIVGACHESREDGPQLATITVDELGNTLLGRLIEGVSRRPGQSLEQRRIDAENLLEMLKKHPLSFIGRVEATIGYRKALSEVLDQ